MKAADRTDINIDAINMKYIITENQLRKVQFKYLDFLFEDIYEVMEPEIPNTIFFKKDSEIVFAIKTRRYNELEVSYPIWKNIEDMFSLDYGSTQDLMEEWAEQHLGFGKIRAESVDFF